MWKKKNKKIEPEIIYWGPLQTVVSRLPGMRGKRIPVKGPTLSGCFVRTRYYYPPRYPLENDPISTVRYDTYIEEWISKLRKKEKKTVLEITNLYKYNECKMSGCKDEDNPFLRRVNFSDRNEEWDARGKIS